MTISWPLFASAKMGSARHSLGSRYGGLTNTAAAATIVRGANFSVNMADEESAAMIFKWLTLPIIANQEFSFVVCSVASFKHKARMNISELLLLLALGFITFTFWKWFFTFLVKSSSISPWKILTKNFPGVFKVSNAMYKACWD